MEALRRLSFLNVNNKAQMFVVDGLFALIFLSLLILVFPGSRTDISEKNIELLRQQKIGDLLVTSQYLKISGIDVLEKNYLLLFPETPGYIRINNKRKEIGNNIGYKKVMSNSIKYINNSNNKIYIEIGVYSN